MKQARQGRNNFHLDLGRDVPKMKDTVDSYIHDRVVSLAEEKAYDDELREMVVRELRSVSCGNYLWVDVACAALRDVDMWHIEDFLKLLAANLDLRSLYRCLGSKIKDIMDGNLCLEVLTIMSVVWRSVRVEELESLVRLPPRVNLRAIIHKCSAFLRNPEDLVSFHHHSVREYVRERFLDKVTTWECHAALTGRCLESVAAQLPSTSIRQHEDKNQTQADQVHAISSGHYALLHWITHLHEVCKTIGTDTIRERECWGVTWRNIRRFLEYNFISWVNVLLKERKLVAAASKLQEVELCLGEKGEKGVRFSTLGEVHRQVRDAHYFLRLQQSFGVSSNASAYNAVIFCPGESIIRNYWFSKAVPWLEASPLVRQNWAHSFHALERHRDWVRSLAFSTDGHFLASGSDDYSVNIWDIETGTVQHNVKVQNGWIYSVAFSSQGIIAVGSNDAFITLWDASTGKEHARWVIKDGVPHSLCFSPDGTRLASTGSSTVDIWAMEQNRGSKWSRLATFNELESKGQAVTFFSEGKQLAAGSYDGRIAIWDMETLQLKCIFLAEHDTKINCIAFSADGSLVAAGSAGGLASIWNISRADSNRSSSGNEDGTEVLGCSVKQHLRASNSAGIECITFSPDAQGLRLATASRTSIHIWDTKTGASLHEFHAIFDDIFSISFEPRASYLAAGMSSGAVHLWYGSAERTATESDYRTFEVDEIVDLTVDPSGKIIAASCHDGSDVLWDVEKTERLQRELKFGHDTFVLSLAFSPDGKYLLSGSGDNTARVCDVMTGDLLHTYTGHDNWIRGTAWSHCGKYIATASDDGMVCVQEMGQAKEVILRPNPGKTTCCVTFSIDDNSVVAGGVGDNVAMWTWDAKQGKLETEVLLRGHTGDVRGILVTHASKRVVSSASDGTVRVWDTETRAQRQVIQVAWAIYKKWTAPQSDDYIMSAQGALSLNPSASSTPPWCPWSLRYEHDSRRWWIVLGENKAICIPPAIYPRAACIMGERVIMGTPSHLHVCELSSKRFRYSLGI
ncbi:WD40-repeat-containing domain protein [Hypoxylon sp. FL1284]|nr:WD40-repeat-containing domain protein [Hypoxylon sp. FL1284]